MGKYIAVEGCTLSLSTGTGTITISTQPSNVLKAGGKGVYCGNLNFSITGYSSTVVTVAGSGSATGSISPTSTTVSSKGNKAVLEGDNTTVTVTGLAYSGSSTVTVTETVIVTVESAGQTVVKAA